MESKKKCRVLRIPSKPRVMRGIRRSDTWPTIRLSHLQQQPECQACGSRNGLEVHHIIPIHVDKSKELTPTNLITLCENPATGFCHYIFGHLALSWFHYDADVIQHVSHHRTAIEVANETQNSHGKPIRV